MRKLRRSGAFAGLFVLAVVAVIGFSSMGEVEIEFNRDVVEDPLRNAHTYRILVVGDTGGIPILQTTRSQRKVAKVLEIAAEAKDIQLVLNLGDNIYFTGATDEYDYRFKSRFEDVYSAKVLDVPWLMIAGNHDHFGNVSAQVEYTKHSSRWYFPSLYYKKTVEFNHTKIEFLQIDTITLCGNTKDVQNGGFFDMLKNESHDPQGPLNKTYAEDQWAWLEHELNSTDAEYVIVSGHYPVHSMSSHGPTKCLRDRLVPLLEKYNVNAYFSGHDHTLQHFVFNGKEDHKIHYIVSGAASRADASTKHLDGFSTDNLLYHYPIQKSFISWSPFSQLGFGAGGLMYLEFGHETADFVFYDKDGGELYTSSIPKRKAQ